MATASALALVTLLGCSAERDPMTASDERPVAAATPDGSAGPDPRDCDRSQKSALIGLNVLVQRLTLAVLNDRATADVQKALAARVRAKDRATSAACASAPLKPLADAVAALPSDGVSEPALSRVVDAFETWAGAVGPPQWARIVYHRDPCVPLTNNVEVDFRVRYEADAEGKRAWLAYTVRNDWWMDVYVDHGGRAEARGLRPDGRTAAYMWGASSADTAGGGPGTVDARDVALVPSRWRTPGPPPEDGLPLLPDGRLCVLELIAWAYSRDGLPTCDLGASLVS